MIEENIDLYSIKHNQLWRVKKLNMAMLNEFKLMSRIDFKFGYQKLQNDPVFKNLPPQIKAKIEKLITKE